MLIFYHAYFPIFLLSSLELLDSLISDNQLVWNDIFFFYIYGVLWFLERFFSSKTGHYGLLSSELLLSLFYFTLRLFIFFLLIYRIWKVTLHILYVNNLSITYIAFVLPVCGTSFDFIVPFIRGIWFYCILNFKYLNTLFKKSFLIPRLQIWSFSSKSIKISLFTFKLSEISIWIINSFSTIIYHIFLKNTHPPICMQ